MIDTAQRAEQVILVAVCERDLDETQSSLDELEALAETAGAVVLEKVVQSRERRHPGTYLGKGKLEELKARILELGADGIICDDELTPAQIRNMENILDTKIMDRTLVILDIFAARAATREGKIQVELAQLRYRATHLIGTGKSLSRLGGGIGTRGPGETKLESDRRVIHDRISRLKKELEDVCRHREVARQQRSKNRVPVAAIVGYTNAGKSTLLGTLSGSDIYAEDKLFATLDPTTRSIALSRGEELLLTDTVGFINKLPHHLIDAFRSTLEEAKYADMILHVVDGSNPEHEAQMATVYRTLDALQVGDKPVLTLFNKCDAGSPALPRDPRAGGVLRISARTGEGLEELTDKLGDMVRGRKLYIEKLFPYAEAGRIQQIRRQGTLMSEEYRDDGLFVAACVPAELAAKLK